MLKTMLMTLPIVALFAYAVYYLLVAWHFGDDVQVGAAGYIAMGLGVAGTLALAGVLIVLLLRRGPDED